MTIGTNIIKFDNSLGTVKEFNEIFHLNKLKDCSGDVEILGIVGVGKEATRLISVSGELREYDFNFIPKSTAQECIARDRAIGVLNKKRVNYVLEKDGIKHNFNTRKEAGAFLETSQQYISVLLSRGTTCKGYSVKQTQLK